MSVAKEWESHCGVKFHFVTEGNAMIRVGFDYVPGMMSSWAITGTDHIQMYDRQQEPTIHFAQWRRASNALKRSDVLRAFGQALGLELEFRHPKKHPSWITDDNGNINEAKIQEYWENELAGFITWEELRKVVLDPLASNALSTYQTKEYDPESVMNWPFYEMIADNIPPIQFEEDLKTEISALDKKFVKQLYGPMLDPYPAEECLNLIEFDFTGKDLEINIHTFQDNVIVIWDKDAKEYSRITPYDTILNYGPSVKHSFTESKQRRIVIAEFCGWEQEIPAESHAIKKFELLTHNEFTNLNIKPLNNDLEKILVFGSIPTNIFSEQLHFADLPSLKELYLFRLYDSRVTVENCTKLEIFANTTKVWRPGDPYSLQERSMENLSWPLYALSEHSLSDLYGQGITIRNCPAIKAISLDNTRIKRLTFTGMPNLEYVYLSSTEEYIVSGPAKNYGAYLQSMIQTLPKRPQSAPGTVLLRGVSTSLNPIGNPKYEPVKVRINNYSTVEDICRAQNWNIVWEYTKYYN